MCKALGYVESLSNAITGITQQLKNYTEELKKINCMEQDVLHNIENHDKMNACDGYKYAKQLQEIRRKRRYFKNEIETLQLLEPFAKSLKTQVSTLSDNVSNKYTQLQKAKEEKIYNSRVVKFEEQKSLSNITRLEEVNKTNIKFHHNDHLQRMNELFKQISVSK